MTMQLTPEQEQAAEALVAAGLFDSKAAAIAHYSLKGMEDEAARLASLRAQIAESERESAQGLSKPLDVDALMARVMKRLEADDGRRNTA